MNKLFSLLLTLSLIAGANGVVAQEHSIQHPNQPMEDGILEPITQFDWKYPWTMVTDGRYVYIATGVDPGGEVMVIDTLDPANPVEVASIPIPVGDSLLYATHSTLYLGREGILIYNLSDPANPELVGHYRPLEFMAPSSMVIVGDLAYLADYYSGLVILDISDPFHPVLVGANAEESIWSVEVQGEHAYAIAGGRLIIYDITNPAQPTIVGRYEDRPTEVFTVYGDYAYLSGTSTDVIDISDPSDPKLVTDLPQLNGEVFQLTFKDGLLYVVHPNGLSIYDGIDPLHPVLLGQFVNYWLRRVEPQGGQAFLLDNVNGLHILNTTHPAYPVLSGILTWPQEADYLIIEENKLITLRNSGAIDGMKTVLRVIDTTDPFEPVVYGFLVIHGRSKGKPFIDGSNIYVPLDTGVEIVDASDPKNMQIVARTGSSFAFGVEIYNGLAYTISEDIGSGGWFTINDVSNPASPTLLSQTLFYGTQDMEIAIQGDQRYAYILSFGNLVILDVTNPENPVEIYQDEFFESGYGRLDTETRGAQTIAFLNGWNSYASQLSIIAMDVSDPTHPNTIGVFPTTDADYGSVSVLEVRNGLVYYANKFNFDSAHLILVDFADPAYPKQVASVSDPNGLTDAAVNDEYLFTTPGWGWITVYSLTGDLSGQVTDHNHKPFAAVNLALSTGQEAITGADGAYIFPDLAFGNYTVTPTLEAFSFSPKFRQVNIPSDWGNQDFVILPAPVSTVLEPGTATTLTYTDVQGLPTSFIFPAGLVTTTATASITPTLASGFFGEVFAGHAFDLAVDLGLLNESHQSFTLPVSVTIQYSLDDTTGITDTAKLKLYTLEGSTWVEADTSCLLVGTTFIQEPEVFRGALCEEGQYALLGPSFGIALPMVTFGATAPVCGPPDCPPPLPPLSIQE